MDNILSCCGGSHEPDTPEMYVDFRGYRFKPPFMCMCCGKEICGRQFAFGRTCGVCDMGACNPHNTAYRPGCEHDKPSWYKWVDDPEVAAADYRKAQTSAEFATQLFAEFVEAEKAEA